MTALQRAGTPASSVSKPVVYWPMLRLVAALAVVVLLLPVSASAELLVYEGFDYPEGSLAGQNGGIGFASSWSSGGSVLADSLSYTDGHGNVLPTSGNHGLVSAASGSISAYRDLTHQYGVDATYGPGVYWVSFIGERLQPHANPDDNYLRSAAFQLHNGTGTSGDERFDVGKVTTTDTAPAGPNWALFAHGTYDYYSETTTPMADLAFFVAAIDISDSTDGNLSDTAQLWVDPNLDEPLGTPAAELSGADAYDFIFQRVRLWAGNTSGSAPYAEWVVDEIRIGTTLDDVIGSGYVPVPGDTDGDSVVELADDLDPIRANYLQSVTSRTQGDLTGDLFVDFADFRQWKTAYLEAGGSLSGVNLSFLVVPEPTSAWLLMVGGLLGWRRRRAEARVAGKS